MKSILRNCLHSNEIFLSQESDEFGKPKIIIKSSTSEVGINCIKNEVNGISWYNDQGFKYLSISTDKVLAHYLKTKCNYVPGIIYPYYHGFSKNEKYINSVIHHYCDIWPKSPSKNNLFAIHGDLSMSNVIIGNDNTPTIIDWEHFKENAAPIGFDALNLIFEQAWVEYEINNTIKNIIKKIVLLIQLLRTKHAIDNYFFKNPLSKSILFIRDHKEIWGMQSSKLPILNFSNDLIKIIDDNIMALLK